MATSKIARALEDGVVSPEIVNYTEEQVVEMLSNPTSTASDLEVELAASEEEIYKSNWGSVLEQLEAADAATAQTPQ